MKKLLAAIILIAVCIMGCTSTDDSSNSNASQARSLMNFSEGAGKDWKLIEVIVESTFHREILFNRSDLTKEGDGTIFTLRYDAQTISGVGSPNRYSASYTLGEDRSISIMPMRATLMAALFQPEKLPEHTFFMYMQNSHTWRSTSGRLEFLSKTEDGRDVLLVFGQ
ncbi:MAG: META domain-containing protein [Treponema sp.]|nr:META domain-containing protein [Treponema sp.]